VYPCFRSRVNNSKRTLLPTFHLPTGPSLRTLTISHPSERRERDRTRTYRARRRRGKLPQGGESLRQTGFRRDGTL